MRITASKSVALGTIAAAVIFSALFVRSYRTRKSVEARPYQRQGAMQVFS